jgi:hypothetical protein
MATIDDAKVVDSTQLEKGTVETDGPDKLLNADGSSLKGEDVLALQDLDPALNMKMHLVNNVSSTPSIS